MQENQDNNIGHEPSDTIPHDSLAPLAPIKPKLVTTQLIAKMGVLIALLIVGAQLGFAIPFSLIHVTLATMFVMFIAMLLKPIPALIAISIYVAMGSMGIPVFSAFQNFNVYFAPSGGFVIGFIPATILTSFLIGLLEKRFPTIQGFDKTKISEHNFKRNTIIKYLFLVAILVAFTIVLFSIGTLWFMFVFMRHFAAEPSSISIWAALLAVTIPFLPGELIKGTIVVLGYKPLIRFRNM